MKKYFLILALGLAVAGTSQAQDGPQRARNSENRTEQGRNNKVDGRREKGKDGERRAKLTPEQRATQRTEMLSQKLDLNNSQQRKLQALNLKYAQQMQSVRGDFAKGTDRKAKGGERNDRQHEQMERLQASWENEFKDIVSKKQYAQYQEEKQQMLANRGNRAGKSRDNTRNNNR